MVNAVMPISSGSHAPWVSLVRLAAKKSRSMTSRTPPPASTIHSGVRH